MSSFCEMAARLQDAQAIHQPSPSPLQHHPPQFALQTLPQRVYAAAAAGYVLDTDGANSSDSSDSELESNQFEVADGTLASLTRRKAQLAAQQQQQQQEPSAMAPSRQWQQHSPLREPIASASAAATINESERDGNQHTATQEQSGERQYQRSSEDNNSSRSYATAMATASLRLERLEAMAHDLQAASARKRSTRSPGANADRPQTGASPAAATATAGGVLSHQYEHVNSASASSPARPASPSDPYEATLAQSLRRHAAVRMDDAAIQDEIRSVLAQTEQLLVAAQSQSQSQAHQPHPPLATTAFRTSSPLRSSRASDSDAVASRDALLPPYCDSEDASESEASSTHSELSDGEMDDALQPMQAPRFMRQAHEAAQSVLHADNGNEAQAREQAPLPDDATNRAINATKARALEVAMLANLLRLGFHERLTRRALDAGVHEIAHYDADCELAYVDIFLSLVRMVCDAHVDAFSHRAPASGPSWMAPGPSSPTLSTLTLDRVAMGSSPRDTNGDRVSLNGRSSDASPPFKWPVFDMAQFEFGNARPGTCFDSVCVLTNLPKVALDRTDELLEALASHLFRMLGDPVQVVIPSAGATGRTKGHAFLEFDDHALARACATAIDGLQWGRGPFGRIRSRLFREYHVKSSPPSAHPLQPSARDRAASSASMASDDRGSRLNYRRFGLEDGDADADEEDGDGGYAPDTAMASGASDALLRNPFVESSWHDDALFSPVNAARPWQQGPYEDSVYTSSDDGEVDDDDVEDARLLWRPHDHERPLFIEPELRSRLPRPISIDDVAVDAFDDAHLVLPHHQQQQAFASTSRLPPYATTMFHRMRQSPCSSDDDDDDDERFGFRSRGVDDDDDDDDDEDDDDNSWGCDSVLDLQTSDPCSGLLRQHYVQGPSIPQASGGGPSIHSPLGRVDAASPKPGTSAPAPSPSPSPSHRPVHTIDASEKPWRSYCEELIARNREMQEQVAYARRRIVQLGHNNQKLHLLIDRVERDRDGLVFENDVLQTQLQGVADHEQHHAALLTEVAKLRKRLRKSERADSESSALPASLTNVRTVLQHDLSASALGMKDTDELKDWEQVLESALARVRVTKEAQALARQKALDRQVEAQQELKLCVICLANDKSILCLPCRHLCLCEACSAHEEVEKCPICRLHIDEMLQVYA